MGGPTSTIIPDERPSSRPRTGRKVLIRRTVGFTHPVLGPSPMTKGPVRRVQYRCHTGHLRGRDGFHRPLLQGGQAFPAKDTKKRHRVCLDRANGETQTVPEDLDLSTWHAAAVHPRCEFPVPSSTASIGEASMAYRALRRAPAVAGKRGHLSEIRTGRNSFIIKPPAFEWQVELMKTSATRWLKIAELPL